MKNVRMAKITRDNGSCPVCGHKKFFVSSISHTIYITNTFGSIIDYKDLSESAIAECFNCHSRFDVIPTPNGFYAVSKLEKIILDNTVKTEDDKPEDYVKIDNPMKPS